MKTVRLQLLLAQIAALNNLTWAEVSEQDQRQYLDLLALRTQAVWEAFHWPELRVTELRYFQLGAHLDGQEYAAGEIVWKDEAYWQADEDTSTTPADDTAWTKLAETPARLIPWAQPLARELDTIYGVYACDPRSQKNPRSLPFTVDGDGVWVQACVGRAWVAHRPPPPLFAGKPFAADQATGVGEARYFASSGECYKCVAENAADAPAALADEDTPATADIVTAEDGTRWATAAGWERQEAPAFLRAALVHGAHADRLRGKNDSTARADADKQEAVAQAALLAQMKRFVHQQAQTPRFQPQVRPRPGGYRAA